MDEPTEDGEGPCGRRLAGRHIYLGFYLVLLGWLGYLLVTAASWEWEDNVLPLLVVVPAIVLVGYQLTTFLPADPFGREPLDERTTGLDPGELYAVGWLVGLAASIFYLGFHLSIPAFIFVYVWRASGDGRRAALVTAAVSAFFYVLFVVLLRAQLWPGRLFVGL